MKHKTSRRRSSYRHKTSKRRGGALSGGRDTSVAAAAAAAAEAAAAAAKGAPSSSSSSSAEAAAAPAPAPAPSSSSSSSAEAAAKGAPSSSSSSSAEAAAKGAPSSHRELPRYTRAQLKKIADKWKKAYELYNAVGSPVQQLASLSEKDRVFFVNSDNTPPTPAGNFLMDTMDEKLVPETRLDVFSIAYNNYYNSLDTDVKPVVEQLCKRLTELKKYLASIPKTATEAAIT